MRVRSYSPKDFGIKWKAICPMVPIWKPRVPVAEMYLLYPSYNWWPLVLSVAPLNFNDSINKVESTMTYKHKDKIRQFKLSVQKNSTKALILSPWSREGMRAFVVFTLEMWNNSFFLVKAIDLNKN